MDWMKQVSDVLDRYGDVNPNRPPDSVHADFDRFAQQAPPEAIQEGLSAAFRSDQTPEFAQMASQLFGRAPGYQRAGMLNALLVGPDSVAAPKPTAASSTSHSAVTRPRRRKENRPSR